MFLFTEKLCNRDYRDFRKKIAWALTRKLARFLSSKKLDATMMSQAKMDSINIMTDVLPEEMPMTVMQSMKLGIDVNRHKVTSQFQHVDPHTL